MLTSPAHIQRNRYVMNSSVSVITHPSNVPCVHPTRLINRDLTKMKRIIAEFRKVVLRSGFKPAFQLPGTHSLDIVNQLEQRASTPWRINQGGASLCGPAAFMYCLAKDAPELYVQYVFDLYVTGQAKINDLVVEPSSACRTANIVATNRNGFESRRIDGVDWVALASLRDSTNRFLRHKSVSSDAAGITMPGALSEWFSAAGYQWVQNNTRTMSALSAQHFLESAQHYQHNKNVCLFIASKVKKSSFTLRAVPNHWVVMSDAVRFSGRATTCVIDPVKTAADKEAIPQVGIYHWGIEKDLLNASNLTLEDFSRYYFGSVVVG